MISSEEKENAWQVASTWPRDIPGKLPHCPNKSSKLVVLTCSLFALPVVDHLKAILENNPSIVSLVPTGRGYKIQNQKTCPCHKKLQSSLPFMYDMFVRMQFARAVPWHPDSWVVWVLKLRREICEILRSFLFFVRVPIGSETVANVATQMLQHPSDANSCNVHNILQSRWYSTHLEIFCTKLFCWRFVVWEHPSYFATGLFMVPRSLADIEFLNFSICLLNLAAIEKKHGLQRCMHC